MYVPVRARARDHNSAGLFPPPPGRPDDYGLSYPLNPNKTRLVTHEKVNYTFRRYSHDPLTTGLARAHDTLRARRKNSCPNARGGSRGKAFEIHYLKPRYLHTAPLTAKVRLRYRESLDEKFLKAANGSNVDGRANGIERDGKENEKQRKKRDICIAEEKG